MLISLATGKACGHFLSSSADLSEEEPDLCSSSPPSEELRGGKSRDSGFRGEENRAVLAVSAAVINKDAPPTDVADLKARLL